MPSIIDPETMHVDDLPVIWSPVQWNLTNEERLREIEAQATASLLWAADVPEAILRLLLSETDIERIYDPPKGYNPEEQGEWDKSIITFQYKRPFKLIKVLRETDYIYLEYHIEDYGYWSCEINPECVLIQRI